MGMRISRFVCCLLIGIFMLTCLRVSAQTRTVGRIYYDDSLASLGYTLFTPNQSFKTYLIENCGLKVHEWYSAFQPGMMALLRKDGLLLRTGRDYANNSFPSNGGNGGYLELLEWWSNRLWVYKVSTPTILAHHDIATMPNGNVLCVAWEKFDDPTSKLAGRNPALMTDGEVWGEVIYEIKPVYPDSGVIVWEWHVWDHLIQDFDSAKANYGSVVDHPELMDINYVGISLGHADWLHANGLAYNEYRDEIVVSFRETSEVIVLDHSTTTAEAAGHTGGFHGKGGDIIYRWGNPEAYRRGTPAEQRLFQQHDAHWVEDSSRAANGELIIFNNGFARPGGYSSVEFVQPTLDSMGRYVILGNAFQPDSAQVTFRPNPGDTIDSPIMAGAELLPNGNLFVTQAVHGRFVEFDPNGTRVWDYISPALPLSTFVSQGSPVPFGAWSWNNAVFKARKYMPEYPGLDGKPLPHLGPLENNPYPDSTCFTPVGQPEPQTVEFDIFPNPASDVLHLRSRTPQRMEWVIFDALGMVVRSGTLRGTQVDISLADLPAGMYIARVGKDFHRKIIVRR